MPKQQTRDNDGLHTRRGVWYFCLVVDGKRRFFSTKTRSYAEGRKVRAKAVRDQQEHRLPNDQAKLRFEKLLEQVTADRQLHLAENSRRIERERSVPLLAAFRGKRVCEIDNRAIRAYQLARSKHVGARTINLESRLLRHVLKAAQTWGNIADEFKSLPEDRQGPGRALEPEQEKRLFEKAQSKPAWAVAFYAGLVASNTTMRSCELKGLRLQDVELTDKQIIIRRSKTNAGERWIPLNGAALWAFARLLERAAALGSVDPDHFLFPAFRYRRTKAEARGTGFDPARPQKTWRTAWRSLTKAADLAGLRFHDLRHSAITKLAEGGKSDSTIMAIAGHLDRSMMEHYSHIRRDAKRAAVESMPCYFDPEAAAPAAPAPVPLLN